MKLVSSTRGPALACALALTFPLAAGVASAAGPVTIQVNGQTVALNPAPTERAGRVFVPLRGIFERLGATVVYQGGTINATGNNRTVSLHIGSTSATVNGQQQALDVAPFIIGASTYVPLRFVSQALGAQVNYDGTNNIVAISTGGQPVANAPAPQPAQTAAPQRSSLDLASVSPGRDATVEAKRPTIDATFGNGQADPNTLRITLDGLDVTNQTSRSPSGIVYSPPSDLQPTRHVVVVSGKDTRGRDFTQRWAFTSGTSQVINQITDLRPADGASVGSSFTVRGHTLPNAHVTIQAGAVASIGGLLALGTGTYRGDTTADADGNFSQDVSLNAVSGGQVNLVVSSTEPRSKAAAQVKERLTVR